VKVLIVDFHAGCIQTLLLSLLKSGHDVEVLSFSKHNFIFDDEVYKRYFLSGEKKKQLEDRLGLSDNLSIKDAACNWKSIEMRTDRIPIYDVAVAMFPPSLALSLVYSGIARHTVMLAAHRADLWISKSGDRRIYWQTLNSLIERGEISVAATNHLDAQYISNYLPECSIPLLELPAYQIFDQSQLGDRESPFLAFGYSQVSKRAIRNFEELYGIEIVPIETALKHPYSYAELLQFSGFFYVPYSAYSITLLELECSGLPVVVPDDNTLMRSKVLHDVRLWHHYASFLQVMTFDFFRKSSLNFPGRSNLNSWCNLMQWNTSTLIASNCMALPQSEGLREKTELILKERLLNLNNFLRQLEK
jgi:hypothetical protein